MHVLKQNRQLGRIIKTERTGSKTYGWNKPSKIFNLTVHRTLYMHRTTNTNIAALQPPTCISLSFSLFLIQAFPWPCGSINRGYLVALVTIMPFWTDNSSFGNPWRFHSPTWKHKKMRIKPVNKWLMSTFVVLYKVLCRLNSMGKIYFVPWQHQQAFPWH